MEALVDFSPSLGEGLLWLQCRSEPIVVHNTEIHSRYMWGYARTRCKEKWELSLLHGQEAYAIVSQKGSHNFAGYFLTLGGRSLHSLALDPVTSKVPADSHNFEQLL